MKSITIEGFIPERDARIIEETFNSLDAMYHSGKWTAEQHEAEVWAYIEFLKKQYPGLIHVHDDESDGEEILH